QSDLYSENSGHLTMEMGSICTVKTVPCPVCFRNKTTLAESNPDQTVFRLNHGGLLVRLSDPKKNHQLQVQTPTAVASVRGTAFWMHVHHNGEETLSVLNGTVELERSGFLPEAVRAAEAADIVSTRAGVFRRPVSVFERDTMMQVAESEQE
ncbi:MAG: FecR domain-containing protein, partial [Candidatus Omnitrophica bacterium]|nr:FecR domain-containing protein [Candidatus Omnitrophota bacterium]